MSGEKSGQQTREQFYSDSRVKNYLKSRGIPQTSASFRGMVASGSDMKLDTPAGLKLIETLGNVTFSKHPQQINVMDKSTGRTIVSIPI